MPAKENGADIIKTIKKTDGEYVSTVENNGSTVDLKYTIYVYPEGSTMTDATVKDVFQPDVKPDTNSPLYKAEE